MKTKVRVNGDEAGNVVVPSVNNPTWGYIRVSQDRMEMQNGFARRKKYSALINGTVSDLKAFGFTAGQELEGSIVIVESLKPFSKVNSDADFKVAGKTNIVCTIDDQPIYRKTFYVTDSNATDTLIEHDNGEVIKAAFAKLKLDEKESSDLSLS